MGWVDFGPNTTILFWARPGPEDRILAQAKTGGGNYFPPTPACRTHSVLHAKKEKKKKNARMRGKKSYLARRRWLTAFLAVLWRWLVAASWLTEGGSKQQRRCSVFSVFSRDPPGLVFLKFSTLPSSSYVLGLFSFFFPSLSSLGLFFLLFFLFSLLSVLSSFGSPSFFFFSPPFSPLSGPLLMCREWFEIRQQWIWWKWMKDGSGCVVFLLVFRLYYSDYKVNKMGDRLEWYFDKSIWTPQRSI